MFLEKTLPNHENIAEIRSVMPLFDDLAVWLPKSLTPDNKIVYERCVGVLADDTLALYREHGRITAEIADNLIQLGKVFGYSAEM